MLVITFAESAAGALLPRATELAAHWRARAAAATPRHPSTADATDGAIVRAVLACLDRDARWQGEVMRLGWSAGAEAHTDGLAIHHVLKDADLLLAILLAAIEEAARDGTLVGGTPADALAVARRMQQAVSLHSQAAATSFLHCVVAAMRARWRVLRHDLRNPLGTIRSALSLMEDDAVPAEARTGPKVRAMLSRNAGALENLIASELGERVPDVLLAAPQDVSLRDVALAVRRTLRDPLRLAECDLVVDDALPDAHVDEAGFELTLSTLLLAAIAGARAGDVLHVCQSPEGVARRGAIALRIASTAGEAHEAWDADGLSLATAIATEYGGRVVVAADALDLELRLLPNVEEGAGRRGAERRPRASERHVRDDVARAD